MAASAPRKTTYPSSALQARVDARPRRTAYQALAALVWLGSAAAFVYFALATRGAAVPAATAIGRWYGLAGLLLILFLSLYPCRRALYRSTRLGSLPFWYRAHLLGGVLALALVGSHCASAALGDAAAGGLPGVLRNAARSPFLAALQVGFWGVTATGLLGWCWQTWFTRWLGRRGWPPACGPDLVDQRARLLEELERQVEERGAAGGAYLRASAREALARARQWAAIRRLTVPGFRSRQFWDREAESLFGGAAPVPPGSAALLRDLNRVEVLLAYQAALRWWTGLHLFFTALLVAVTGWHVYLVTLYPR